MTKKKDLIRAGQKKELCTMNKININNKCVFITPF